MTDTTGPDEVVEPAAEQAQAQGESFLDKVKEGAHKVGDKVHDGLEAIEDKVKDVVTDERIDQVAAGIKKITPAGVDEHITSAADKAKSWNDH